MAEKASPAAAERDPVPATVTGTAERDGQHWPVLRFKGDAAPRKGSTLRVTLENGVTYAAKIHAAIVESGEVMADTEGLEPELPAKFDPRADVVPG
jgi:hypothetical protein